MRNAFAGDITWLAYRDDRIVLLSGDIGNRLFNVYKTLQPEQFMNCGVAEANMMSMAGGMALSGLRPFVYSITPFVTTRCMEQIRDDVCYHNVPVTIVPVGAGFCYSACGPTHHAAEDIAMMRSLPNMTVLCPADPMEVRGLLPVVLEHDGPVYLRIGKKNEPVIHNSVPEMSLGSSQVIRDGDEVCVLNAGITLPETLKAADSLDKRGISTNVVSYYSVKPLDKERLHQVFSDYEHVFTVEEHSRNGGFGSAVAEWVSDQNRVKANLHRIGTDDRFLHEAGNQQYARAEMGIDASAIVDKITTSISPPATA